MAITNVRGRQLKDDDVFREDLNISVSGKAVITKVIPGTNIAISSTGVDAGTGDVTVNLTGTVGVANGGTGATSLTGVLIGNGTSAITAVVGTASQLLRRNAGNTAYEFFTPNFASITPGTVNVLPKYTSGTGLGPSNISDSGTLITLGSNSVVSGSLTTGIISASAASTVGLFTDTRSNIHTLAASFKIQNNADASVSTLAHNLLDLDYAAQASGVTGQYVRFLTGGTERVGIGLVNDDFVITTAATTRLTVTQAGNMGLGVTPSAWNTSYRAIQVGGSGALWSASGTGGDIYLSSNVLFNTSSNYVRLNTGFATDYYQLNGQHVWRTAVSAAAGSAISFTTAMTLTATGNLLVGTATDNTVDKLQVNGSFVTNGIWTTSGAVTLWGNGTTKLSYGGLTWGTGYATVYATTGNDLLFGANGPTTKVTLKQNGNFLLNTTTDNGARLQVNGITSIQGTSATDGGQLGTELLTSANWTSTGWTGDFATGFTHTTGNTTVLSNTLAAVANTLYQLSWTVTNRTAGSFTIAFGGYTSGALSATGNVGPQATTTGNLIITPTTDFNGTIVMSIRVITAGSAIIVLRNSAGNIVNEIRALTDASNTSYGSNSTLRITTGTLISAYGQGAAQNTTTSTEISAFGVSALNQNTTGNRLNAFGSLALQNLVTGSDVSAFGQGAGRRIANGTNLISATNGLYLGNDTRPNANGNINEIIIGTSVIGNGSNTVTIGNSSITTNFFTGVLNVTRTGLNGIGAAAIAQLRSDGRTANDAVLLNFSMQNSSSAEVQYGRIISTIISPTAGGHSSRMTFNTFNAGVVVNAMALWNDGAVTVNGIVNNGVDKLQVTGSGLFTTNLAANKFVNNGVGTFSAFTADGQMQMYVTTADGLLILSRGATNDFVLGNKNGSTVFNVPTGTRNIIGFGDIVASGTTASTSTTTGALRSAGGLGVAGAGFFGAGITATTGTFSSIVRVNGSTGSDALNIAGNVRLDGVANRIFRMGSSTNYNYSFRTSGDDFQLWEAEVGARMVVRFPTGNIGMGTTTPHLSAKLDLTSTTQGFLPPRMTQAQRIAIASPADGLMVIQTDGTRGYYVFIEGVWRTLAMV